MGAKGVFYENNYFWFTANAAPTVFIGLLCDDVTESGKPTDRMSGFRMSETLTHCGIFLMLETKAADLR